MNYILTHKDFELPKFIEAPHMISQNYSIVTNGAELSKDYGIQVYKADNDLKPLKQSYCEGYMLKEIYLNLDHWKDNDWIGINHYRRYFPKPTNEATLPIPHRNNLHIQYATCHNINDLLQVESIIDKCWPEYSMDYSSINVIFPANMFILRRMDFDKWYNFVFGVLKMFSVSNDLHTDQDVRNYVEKNKACYKKFDIDYQSRLHGFLMERLTTIFFMKRFATDEVTLKPIIHV